VLRESLERTIFCPTLFLSIAYCLHFWFHDLQLWLHAIALWADSLAWFAIWEGSSAPPMVMLPHDSCLAPSCLSPAYAYNS